MKILAIRIKNLASLEGTTDLSFTQEPLCSAGIFAITGPTGAGKSTILDALCLALYAQTPRYDKSNDPNQGILDIAGNTITQSDPRKILRDGAADGYAEVDFEGVDGHRHRAHWVVRRARNKIEGALQPYQLSCRNLDTNTDEQGTKSEVLASISRKVGLSFEQFTRAVLLPQGDFTAFLKAPNTEKSELLEKLTGTQIYSEISKRIFERHRKEKEELNVLSVQKEGIFILDEQQTEALNKRLEELLHLSTQQQKNEEILARELIWHERLSAFQKTLAESRQAFEVADTRKKETADRELKLAQVEQVQPVRVWVQGLAGQQEVFTSKQTKQKNVEEELLQWQEQQKKQNELLETASQQLDLKTKEQEQCQPLLDQAKQLDTQLKDQVKILEVKQAEWQQAKETLEVQEKEIQQQQLQAQVLQKTVEMLEAYIAQHQTRRPLAENEKLIVKTLGEAQVTLQEEKSALEEIKNTEKELGEKQAAEKVQTEKLALMKEVEKKQADIYTNAQKLISAIDGKALQQNKNDADAKLLETTQAVGDWNALSEMTAFLEKDKVIVKKSKKELEEGTQQLQILTKELPVIQIRKESSYHAFEMARQESSADVVSLREQLVQDQECPVCGSKEHPYVKHDPTVEKVLARLEADYKQQEKAHEGALIQQSALQEKTKQLGKEIENLSIQQKDKEGKIKEYRKNWIRFSLHSEVENRTAGEVEGWLKLQQKEHKAKQKKWQQELDQWQEQQRELEQHRKEHEKLAEQGRVAENVLKDLRRDIESQKEKLAQVQKDNNKAANRLAQTQESLTIYFANKDWFDKWKENADKFIQQITQFSSDWRTNLEKLDKSKQEKEIRETAIKGEQNKLQVHLADVNKKQADVVMLRQQHKSLLDARKQLFEGRAVETVEKQLKDAVTKAREELEQNKVQLEQIKSSITRSSTQREEIQQDIERLTGEITRLDQKIIQWLETYNTTSPTPLERKEMEALLILPENWIEKERKELQQVKNILLQAQTLMQEHQKMLDKHLEHPLSERPMEMVTEQLAVIRTELKETHREDAEIKLRFKQDGENRQKAGALLEQIAAKEILVNNWAMLNQVIGSADGKKFRQVAQEYTLDVLLGYTNVQLDMLSKRYLLERIPGSLGLQVIDQDMGNEVRTVNSLSGGESFLVSLALALGLASLSSSRMQVESLFIDEGFGSLDPATLNIAMDALERLHNQGRKVGVISHVQEMTERLPVQIKVSKQQSGRSKVEVIGF